jgi:hypothetical protein
MHPICQTKAKVEKYPVCCGSVKASFFGWEFTEPQQAGYF